MELTDIDSSDEEQEMRILNLRRLLHSAEARIGELESQVSTLQSENELLATGDGAHQEKFDAILTAVRRMETCLQEAGDALGDIADAIEEKEA